MPGASASTKPPATSWERDVATLAARESGSDMIRRWTIGGSQRKRGSGARVRDAQLALFEVPHAHSIRRLLHGRRRGEEFFFSDRKRTADTERPTSRRSIGKFHERAACHRCRKRTQSVIHTSSLPREVGRAD